MSQSNNKYKQGKGLGSEKKWEREREKGRLRPLRRLIVSPLVLPAPITPHNKFIILCTVRFVCKTISPCSPNPSPHSFPRAYYCNAGG